MSHFVQHHKQFFTIKLQQSCKGIHGKYFCVGINFFLSFQVYMYQCHLLQIRQKNNNHTEFKNFVNKLRTFVRKFSNIDFFLKILPLKDDELVMSEM